ncbi:ABC transporter substrate-binding protein [Brachybacterium sp. GPGPB12]|uniref:ABC transporter substrate-binding protein n=1 Tax=Brachybacterium sp. GPGPB12 TaxID=3023517 RepID=UPI003134311F
MSIHSTRRHLLGALGAGGLALGAAACGGSDPFEEDGGSGAAGSDGGGEAPAGTLAIGSQAYYSNEIIAELFAQVLEKAGFTVDRQYQIGQREVYMPELEAGSLDLLCLSTSGTSCGTTSPTRAPRAPRRSAPPSRRPCRRARVLSFAEASDQDSYTTTSDFASTHSLSAIGDLAGVEEDLKIAANSEFETRPYGPEGAKAVYDVDIAVVPVEDSGGPLTVQALLDGDVQLADIYSADPSIAENDLVVLEDPESMILPQNVVPVVSEKIDEQAADAIESVIAELSAGDLVEPHRQSVVDQASSADIATGWLTEKGLL